MLGMLVIPEMDDVSLPCLPVAAKTFLRSRRAARPSATPLYTRFRTVPEPY
jgi:hypothetical protein